MVETEHYMMVSKVFHRWSKNRKLYNLVKDKRQRIFSINCRWFTVYFSFGRNGG